MLDQEGLSDGQIFQLRKHIKDWQVICLGHLEVRVEAGAHSPSSWVHLFPGPLYYSLATWVSPGLYSSLPFFFQVKGIKFPCEWKSVLTLSPCLHTKTQSNVTFLTVIHFEGRVWLRKCILLFQQSWDKNYYVKQRKDTFIFYWLNYHLFPIKWLGIIN